MCHTLPHLAFTMAITTSRSKTKKKKKRKKRKKKKTDLHDVIEATTLPRNVLQAFCEKQWDYPRFTKP